jgi:hypothetical protein
MIEPFVINLIIVVMAILVEENYNIKKRPRSKRASRLKK